MLVPLYGFLEGDTMGLLILAHDAWTMEEVAETLRKSASVRLSYDGPLAVHAHGIRLAPGITVARAGLKALDCVQVRREAADV